MLVKGLIGHLKSGVGAVARKPDRIAPFKERQKRCAIVNNLYERFLYIYIKDMYIFQVSEVFSGSFCI